MDTPTPLVSIVIPCYNHEKYVKAAIQSAIDQDYANIELIVIDDGSGDESVQQIRDMLLACQSRFTRFEFRHRENRGLAATLNEALAWSNGIFFAPVASDDVLRPEKTRIQVDHLNTNPQSAGVFGSVATIGACGKLLPGRFFKLRRFKQQYLFSDIFLHRHRLPAPSQMLRAVLVKQAGGYSEKFFIEDWSMWLALTQHGASLDYIDRDFAYYRRHAGNTSSKLHAMMEGRVEILDVYKHHQNYRLALAEAYMVAAHEWQWLDNSLSLALAKKAIKTSTRIIVSISMLKYHIKFLTFWRI